MEIIQLLIVLGISIIELWAAIPVGFALNLNPAVIIVTSSIGSILGATIIVVAGEKIRNKIIKWHNGGKENSKQSRLYRIWDKYGVVGLGLLSPLLFGALIGAAVGSLLGAKKLRLLLWMSVGILVWSTFLTLIGLAGINSIESLFG
jgi:hypothetical protein